LHLPARQRADGAILEAGEADGGDSFVHPVTPALVDAAEQAGVVPQAHRHHVEDVDRKTAVDLGRLRQIGDIAGGELAALDAPGERLDHADDALEQGRLAGAVRADHRHQRTGVHGAIEMMHRRVAVVAKRQVVEAQRCGHPAPDLEFTSWPRARPPRSTRSARPPPPAARPRTTAGSTAKSTPADDPARGDGGDAGGRGRASAWSTSVV
jgi:hypothetical protein